MAEVNQDASLIQIHGRAGLKIPYTRFRKTATNRDEQIDISQSIIYMEIPAINLRKRLVANPSDTKGLLLKLTRSEVEQLPTVTSEFAVVDETDIEAPDVEWIGKIVRIGYIGDPSL